MIHHAKRDLMGIAKIIDLVSLRNPRSLTTVETFPCWHIFCVLSDNSNSHFEIVESYRPVLASFPFLAHLSTMCSKGAFRVVLCPSYVERRALSTISLNIFSSKPRGQFGTSLAGMLLGRSSFKIVRGI